MSVTTHPSQTEVLCLPWEAVTVGRECEVVGLLVGVEEKRWEQRRAVARLFSILS